MGATAATELTFTRGKRSGKKTTVTATDGASVVHRDEVNLDNAKDRGRFVTDVLRQIPQDDWPEKAAEAFGAKLIELADVPAATAHDATPPDPSADRLRDTPADVLAEAEALLEDPNLMRRVVTDVGKAGVAGEKHTIGTVYLVGTSRKLRRPRPLGAIVQGSTSSGKTWVVGQVAKFFPEEDVICATTMTPQSLYHMAPGSLTHRWIVAGERSRVQDDDTADATRAMREMLSTGELTKLMPVKKEGKGIVTEHIHQQGPIAFTETTTLSDVFEEDANRCLLLSTDESEEQTRKVNQAAARGFMGNLSGDAERLMHVHRAAQRMLPRRAVTIPFADKVAALFDNSRVDSRRNYQHLMGLVAASALLHFRQRGTDAGENLVATSVDYQYAAALAKGPFGRAGGGVSDAVRLFFDRLRKRVDPDKDFSSHDAREEEKAKRATVYGWLTALSEAGAIVQTQPYRGNVPARWLLTGKEPSAGCLTVPDPAKVFAGLDGWTHGQSPWE